MLDAKADNHKATIVGATPLFIAAKKGHREVARLFVGRKG